MHLSLDRKLIESLRKMSDEGLWRLICGISGNHGGEFSKKNPDYKKIRRIRAILDAASDEDLDRLNRLIELYNSTK